VFAKVLIKLEGHTTSKRLLEILQRFLSEFAQSKVGEFSLYKMLNSKATRLSKVNTHMEGEGGGAGGVGNGTDTQLGCVKIPSGTAKYLFFLPSLSLVTTAEDYGHSIIQPIVVMWLEVFLLGFFKNQNELQLK
jgi:hypothetical protein